MTQKTEVLITNRRRRAVAALCTLVIYVGSSFLLFNDVWRAPGKTWIGDAGDPKLQMWFLGWTPASLVRWQNPLFTDYIQYPTGVNMMWNVSTPLPAVLVWPVSQALGLIIAYNLLITLAPALSGWCMYLAAARYTWHFLPAFGAGLLYGFSPFMMAQSIGHIHMALAVFPPLLLLLCDEIFVRQRWPPWLAGLLLGVAGAGQLLTSEEVLASTAVAALMGVGVAVIVFRRQVLRQPRYSFVAILVAAVSSLALAAYPLAFQFLGPLRVGGSLQPPDIYASDLLTFVVPSSIMHFAPAAGVEVTGRFSASTEELSGYLGLPLILLLIATLLAYRRSRLVLWAAGFTLLIGVLSLGPVWHLAGHPFRHTPPWSWLWHLPVIENILPARLAPFIYIGAGLLLATGFDQALRSGHRSRVIVATAAVTVALAALFPSLPRPSTPDSIPTFFQPGGQASRIPVGSVVLITPFSNAASSTAMFWQARNGYRFKLAEGEGYVPGPSLDPPPSRLQHILVGLDHSQDVVTDEGQSQALSELRQWHVRTVIIGPSPGDVKIRAFFTELLGQPPDESGGVAVWWHPLAVKSPP
ncbi:MAG: hypothetical protein JF888_04640 [Candidatus Dormibacteraeota bacterium]|uniref:Glycosyltransferase RgtA/B/C/D-like domain-containing protein n=1 Tax=Candidatus Dormiibacter inghamiae TaxID=3127013 RepID=A0A934K9J7_9BACT|nr:hypothetical protein [Candidatus Dormibacteraeota bacterium]MBJ7605077.1 hypothetical protein [Candidatus Dormibacteraeota bacterium]